MGEIDLEKLTDVDLIKRFERNIVYDVHSYATRFRRSDARKELCRRGAECLKAIADHLRNNPPSNFMDLKTAWGHLLGMIEIQVDPNKTGPKLLEDTAGWIAWADRFSKVT